MLNSLNRYNLSESSDGLTYQFITDSGVHYTAYFICMNCYHTAFWNTYSFSFEHNSIKKMSYDPKIQETISYILELFFENNAKSIIYVCDSSDRRESPRNRLFDQWYRRFSKSPIEKHQIDASTSDYHLFASLFILQNNPDKQPVIEAFNDMEKQYYADKL